MARAILICFNIKIALALYNWAAATLNYFHSALLVCGAHPARPVSKQMKTKNTKFELSARLITFTPDFVRFIWWVGKKRAFNGRKRFNDFDWSNHRSIQRTNSATFGRARVFFCALCAAGMNSTLIIADAAHQNEWMPAIESVFGIMEQLENENGF